MKKLMIFISMLITLIPSVISTKYDNYLSNINDGYDKYTIEVVEKENFKIAIVEGICNQGLTYGVFLGSFESRAYSLKVYIGDNEYALPTDARGDTSVCCVAHPSLNTKICVYDKVGKNSTKRLELELKYYSLDEFNEQSNLHSGMNKGFEVTSMSKKINWNIFVILSCAIFFAIACIGIIVIIFCKKHKKGIFNENKKHESDLKFFENVNEDFIQEDFIDEVQDEQNTVENISVYDKKYYFEEDEEYIDIKPLLQEKGFNVEYANMSEDEKNKVMVYLMILKHDNKISDAQYKKEVSELWKKYS